MKQNLSEAYFHVLDLLQKISISQKIFSPQTCDAAASCKASKLFKEENSKL